MTEEKKSSENALTEAAKAAQQAIPIIERWGERLGTFFYRVVGKGAENLGGAFSDWAAVYRHQNALKLADKVEEIHRKRKIVGKTIPIPPRLSIPLLEKATLENDETLIDMWAGLIANAMDSTSSVQARRTFIELLNSLEPVDALVLQEIERYLIRHPNRKFIDIAPDNDLATQWPNPGRLASALNIDLSEIILSLENIERLGLAFDHLPHDEGFQTLVYLVPITHPKSLIDLTHTGQALLAACRN